MATWGLFTTRPPLPSRFPRGARPGGAPRAANFGPEVGAGGVGVRGPRVSRPLRRPPPNLPGKRPARPQPAVRALVRPEPPLPDLGGSGGARLPGRARTPEPGGPDSGPDPAAPRGAVRAAGSRAGRASAAKAVASRPRSPVSYLLPSDRGPSLLLWKRPDFSLGAASSRLVLTSKPSTSCGEDT